MANFFNSVYQIVAQIPEGKVATYGQIAAFLGNRRGARIVGWAMRSTPIGLSLPCHRVVNKSGTLAPDYIFGGPFAQRVKLEAEGITFQEDGSIDLKKHLWDLPISFVGDSAL